MLPSLLTKLFYGRLSNPSLPPLRNHVSLCTSFNGHLLPSKMENGLNSNIVKLFFFVHEWTMDPRVPSRKAKQQVFHHSLRGSVSRLLLLKEDYSTRCLIICSSRRVVDFGKHTVPCSVPYRLPGSTARNTTRSGAGGPVLSQTPCRTGMSRKRYGDGQFGTEYPTGEGFLSKSTFLEEKGVGVFLSPNPRPRIPVSLQRVTDIWCLGLGPGFDLSSIYFIRCMRMHI